MEEQTELEKLRAENRQLRDKLAAAQGIIERQGPDMVDLEKRVSERTQLLEGANRELEAFCYMVSHDLRSPLRHINGFIEILKVNTPENANAEFHEYMETVALSARAMGRLIDDLLAFSRIQRVELRSVETDLNKLVEDALKELQSDIAGREIVWRIDSLPAVMGDPPVLKQVFLNLLSNAVKYTRTRKSAVVDVETKQDEQKVTICVRDNGVGFSKEYAYKLFGVFQRLHPEGEFEGTGIGLAIVSRIIARHGGTVWAEGETDKGAAFYFTLPRRVQMQ